MVLGVWLFPFSCDFSLLVFRSRWRVRKPSEGRDESDMNFMIHPRKQNPAPVAEPETGRPAGTGEEWLGRNRSSKRRLWERLNPRSRRQIRLIAEALALQQTHAQLPDSVRGRLSAAVDEVERLAGRLRALLAEVARRTPPRV
jgi:hypothetical protein